MRWALSKLRSARNASSGATRRRTPPGDLAAQIGRGALQPGHDLVETVAAQGHHETGGMAQVPAHANLGNGDRASGERVVARLAAGEHLGEHMTKFLAHPQPALSRRAPVTRAHDGLACQTSSVRATSASS